MSSNVVQLPAGPHWRVLVAHRRADVRHVLRTLIEADHVAIVEAADGDAAFEQLERARYDLLVLELDLPGKDGVTLMQLHRVLLMHERIPVPPPAIVLPGPSDAGPTRCPAWRGRSRSICRTRRPWRRSCGRSGRTSS